MNFIEECKRRTKYSLNKQTNPQVCAALVTDNNCYFGNNIFLSNCSILCAEMAAIAQAVAHGDLAIKQLYVAATRTDGGTTIPMPCGNCRQALYDLEKFTGRTLEIIVVGAGIFKLAELLPNAFVAQGWTK